MTTAISPLADQHAGNASRRAAPHSRVEATGESVKPTPNEHAKAKGIAKKSGLTPEKAGSSRPGTGEIDFEAVLAATTGALQGPQPSAGSTTLGEPLHERVASAGSGRVGGKLEPPSKASPKADGDRVVVGASRAALTKGGPTASPRRATGSLQSEKRSPRTSLEPAARGDANAIGDSATTSQFAVGGFRSDVGPSSSMTANAGIEGSTRTVGAAQGSSGTHHLKEATSKEATSHGATPNGAASKEATSKEATSKEATSHGATPKEATSHGATPNGATPNGATPKGAASNQAFSHGATPNVAAPRSGSPSALSMSAASAGSSPAATSATTGSASGAEQQGARLPGVESQLLRVLNVSRPALGGSQSISVALFPAELGAVRATLTSQNGDLVVRLAPTTPQGESAIRQALPELESSLSSNGSSASVVLVPSGGGSSGGPGDQQMGRQDNASGTVTFEERAGFGTPAPDASPITSLSRPSNSAVLDLLL